VEANAIQIAVFAGLTALVALATWWKCRHAVHSADHSRDYFLAGGTLAWPFIAGSLLLTNISAEQIVGMNGAQMMLVAWWEFGAAAGLLFLAHVLVPLYYKHGCTTTTELLEKRLGDAGLRRIVSVLFLLGYMFILLPVVLYTGSVFMKSMFAIDAPIIVIAAAFALGGLAYAAIRRSARDRHLRHLQRHRPGADGRRGDAVRAGRRQLGSLGHPGRALDADRRGRLGHSLAHPADRHGVHPHLLLGDQHGDRPARAGGGLGARGAEGHLRRGGVQDDPAAGGGVSRRDRLQAVRRRRRRRLRPAGRRRAAAVAVGRVRRGDHRRGAVELQLLPELGLGAVHLRHPPRQGEPEGRPQARRPVGGGGVHRRGLAMVPLFQNAQSIIDLLQRLNGLYSMPVLAAFLAAIFFSRLNATAVKAGILFGAALYAVFTFAWSPLHYIHLMAITLAATLAVMFAVDRMLPARQPVAA
jgi:hypothetical protein